MNTALSLSVPSSYSILIFVDQPLQCFCKKCVGSWNRSARQGYC